MMTRKDFEAAASIVRGYRESGINVGEAARTAQGFIRFFKNSNPRFDADRFLAACEPKKEET